MNDAIKTSPEFKALRAEAGAAIADYATDRDFDLAVARLAPIGAMMATLLDL